jgi:hypothetical protein
METDAQGSFVRWQAVTRDYFSSVSNLVLGLATGMIAFLVSGLAASQPESKCLLVLGAISLVLLTASVALAIWCAINRLRDFRATAQIARQRWKGEQALSEARQESKIIGQFSWRLFWWQLVLFGFGAAAVGGRLVAQLWRT